MNFGQSFRLALKSLMTSKMRALLTMLGIIIGVGAVIVITSLGNGMQNMMNEQFEKLGANLVQVQLFMYGGDSRSVDPDDMYELVDKYPQYISGVTPYVSAQLAVRQGSEDFERTSIYGVGETFLNERGATMSGQNLGKGRFISTSTLPATRTYASSALIWRKRPSRATPWASSCPSAGSTLPLSVCWRRTAT